MTVWQGTATFAPSGALAPVPTRQILQAPTGTTISFTISSTLLASPIQKMRASAGLTPSGGSAWGVPSFVIPPHTGPSPGPPYVQNFATLYGRIGLRPVILLGPWYATGKMVGTAALTCDAHIYKIDPVWPGINQSAGSELIYPVASGLEKALADVEGQRLIAIYAELVRDQWDPYAISPHNLGYLAWAVGVNLWEDDWPLDFKRWWVANQWTKKAERGSRLGLIDFIGTVNVSPKMSVKVVNVTVPPARFYPGASLTKAERASFVSRFPQLRLYPYAPRPQLPWLNYLGGFSYKYGDQKIFVKNGRFFGPLRKFYPTNYNAGGLYLRQVTIYDPVTGVETNGTVRTIVGVPTPGQPVTTYDEISLPGNPGNIFYPGNGNKQYLLPQPPPDQNLRHAVVLGVLPNTSSRLVRVPRDGSLTITQFQELFQTIKPGESLIDIHPQQVNLVHPYHQAAFYCGQFLGPKKRKFFVKSDAWIYIYEVWYLFDPTRSPDFRTASCYMGRSRFGMPKYTAEAKVKALFNWPRHYSVYNGFIGKGYFFAPRNTKLVDKIRRATVASMALRDTVLINTRVERVVQVRDATVLDGRYHVGQYIADIT